MRYVLEKYSNPSSRHTCPSCKGKREFSFYVDTATGEILPEQYGYCNRKDKCAYHLSPYHKNAMGESYSHSVWESENTMTKLCLPKNDFKPVKTTQKVKCYIDNVLAEKTQSDAYFAKNDLCSFIVSIAYETEQRKLAHDVFLQYKIGTCSAGCIFWFCDSQNRYHAGQVKSFNLATGKTVKTDWIHSVLHRQKPEQGWLKKYYDQDEKVGCLFGEHLIDMPQNKHKTIVLVESPKNAILSAIFLPQNDFIYLATYSLSAFTPERCKAIVGRKILLLPDLGRGTEVWKQTAPKFLPAGSFDFFELLEKIATDTDRAEGADVADFIIREQKRTIPHHAYLSKLQTREGILLFCEADGCYPASWDLGADYITSETKNHLQKVCLNTQTF